MRDHDQPASFERFVRDSSPSLGRAAYLLTGDRQHAEDLLQSALMRAAVRWGRLAEPEAYVRKILYHEAVSRWRWLGRRPRETPTDKLPPVAAPTAEVDLRLVLLGALRRLTPRQRAFLVLRYYEDRSEADTAALLNCSVGTVKSQTRHALERLRILNPDLAELIGAPTPTGATDGHGHSKRPARSR